MTSQILHAISRLPVPVRWSLGCALTAALCLGALASGATLMSGGVGWSLAALGAGSLLLLASWRNWPPLWSVVGQLLRALVGERGARTVLGVVALLFMIPAGAGAAVAAMEYRDRQVVLAPDGYFPLGVRDTASVEIRLGRGACFGTCPIYELVIGGDGLVQFRGGDHVDSLAPSATRLTRAQVAALLRAFERVDYLSLGDYSSASCHDITDAPSVRTSLRVDGRVKVVNHYGGCARAPEALSRLEWRIDSIAAVQRWVGAGGATRRASMP